MPLMRWPARNPFGVMVMLRSRRTRTTPALGQESHYLPERCGGAK